MKNFKITNCEIDDSLAVEKYIEINKLNKEDFPEIILNIFVVDKYRVEN